MAQRSFFDNGYGVSIICNDFSYGLELAVLKGNEEYWEICYDTPITNDVIGHIDSEDLNDIVESVTALPRPTDAKPKDYGYCPVCNEPESECIC